MPKGYIIAHVTVNDPEAYEAYRARNIEIFEAFDGRFLVRGGASETVEGQSHDRHVVIEFPSYAKAREAYFSDIYQEHMKLRLAASDGDIILVEGAA